MKKYILLLLLAVVVSSCDDMAVVNPELKGVLSTDKTVHTPVTCEQIIIGAYSDMYSSCINAPGFPAIMNGTLQKTADYRKNVVYFVEKPENGGVLNKLYNVFDKVWEPNYKVIAGANSALQAIGTVNENDFEGDTKNQLLGEAYFLRAFGHYNIMRYFAHWWTENPNILPGADRSKYEEYGIIYRDQEITKDNIHMAQLSVKDSYDKLYADLDKAIELIGSYTDATRANNLAARALKARVALMRGDWKTAKEMASDVIASPDRTVDTFENICLDEEGNTEVIFRMPLIDTDKDRWEYTWNRAFNKESGGWGPTDYYKNLIEGDPRQSLIYQKATESDWDVLIKLKPNNESTARGIIYIRLSEMYLIKAEAEMNSTGDALATITEFRNLRNVETSGKDVEKLIYEEWLKEMSFEDGHEWFACIRFNKLFESNVLLEEEGYTNESIVVKYAQRHPTFEKNANTKLKPNPGYNQ